MNNLASICDNKGCIKIAALDHRGSLRKILSEDQLTPFKTLCTKTFAPYVSAVLLDPEYGLGGVSIAKQHNIGLLLSREQTGYEESSKGRDTSLYTKFTSSKLKELGATAIKLLLYYNSDAPNCDNQIKIAEQVKREASETGLPLLLEIVTYPISGTYYHKGDAILHAIKDLKEFSDVLKLEYPIDNAENDLDSAIPYLDQMTSSAEKPWILLSRGMKFGVYKTALKMALREGCKGYAVGRAIWQEVVELETWEQIENFIRTVGRKRIEELQSLQS